MTYTINVVNRTPITINNGATDSSTSLTLVGKNYPNYGQIIEQDLVYLMQNFAGVAQPTNAVTGQLWWNTTANNLQIYTGTGFKVVGGTTVSTSAPTTTPIQGDLWYKSDDAQLYVYSGSAWIVIGPNYTAAQQQTNANALTITDNTSANHTVLAYYVGGTLTGILSKDATFTPQSPITGFTRIIPGYNVNNSIYAGVENIISNVWTAGSVGSTYTVDWSKSQFYTMTLTANCTLSFSNPPSSGKSQTLRLVTTQGGSGSYILTYPAAVRWSNGIAPTLTPTVGYRDSLEFTTYDGGTSYLARSIWSNISP